MDFREERKKKTTNLEFPVEISNFLAKAGGFPLDRAPFAAMFTRLRIPAAI